MYKGLELTSSAELFNSVNIVVLLIQTVGLFINGSDLINFMH
jgi:hypothetical protein